MGQKPTLDTVSDDELRRRLSDFVRQSRRAEADIVAHIAEFDARRLFAREAAPSMFAYCTEVLHFSEPEAYLRIAVARASRRHPALLAMLADGRLHLSGIERLAPHLTEENREGLLKRAEHKSKRQIEELVAELVPRPGAPSKMRKLPAPKPADGTGGLVGAPGLRPDGVGVARSDDGLRPDGVPSPRRPAAAQRPVVEPIAPAIFRVRFDASAELRDKLERLQALMRSSVPDGDLGKIIDVAITKELERLEARRFAKTKKPRKRLAETDTKPKSRYIPAAVRRVVEKRDERRCVYRDKQGRRCTKRHDLDFHHREPFARGGEHSPEVLCLMCRTHNLLTAEQDYGKGVMARHRRRASRDTKAVEVVVAGGGESGLRGQWRSTG